MADSSEPPVTAGRASTVLARPARPGGLDRALARAEAEAALFGDAAPVTVGRYRVIERAGAGGMGEVWSAWDPGLGRAVALKLALTHDAATRARALEEGRALAKLSHPNVVPIYDVIEHDSGVMLVMELVKGETLAAYQARTPTTRELVRAYQQAGAGLAAAHRVGLIHRDFKPQNAILGVDGRVRVLDFGLAFAAEPDAAVDDVAGTPRYMAPEQRVAGPLTAAVDQFALCVALREAFVARGGMPRWIAAVVARGTADDPRARFASMDDLLVALGRDPVTRWRRRGVAGLAVVAIAGSGAAVVLGGRDRAAPTCDGAPALIAGAWTQGRAAVEAHLRQLAGDYAREAAPGLLAQLDRYAAQWVTSHRATCRAHQAGELTASLVEQRAACLGRSRAALTTLAEVAATVDPPQLPNLVLAVSQLPSIEGCEDDDALLSQVAPPPPDRADAVREVSESVAQVDASRDAGQLARATHDIDALVARADALGYRPLQARTRLARGRVAMATAVGDRGLADLERATQDALATGDVPLAIEAFARKVWLEGTRTAKVDLDAVAIFEALAEGNGRRAVAARALLLNNLGSLALAQGDRVRARDRFAAAWVLAAAIRGARAVELTEILANQLLVTASATERAALADDLLRRRTLMVGRYHPLTLGARVQAALLLDDLTAAQGALRAACPDLARYQPTQRRLIGECGLELALVADAAADRALGAQLALGATDGNALARARGFAALAAGDAAAAIAAFTAAGAGPPGPDAPWWEVARIADATLGGAIARAAAGDRAGAATAAGAAAALYDRVETAMPPPVIHRRRALIAPLVRPS
jgi:hypothetical protein